MTPQGAGRPPAHRRPADPATAIRRRAEPEIGSRSMSCAGPRPVHRYPSARLANVALLICRTSRPRHIQSLPTCRRRPRRRRTSTGSAASRAPPCSSSSSPTSAGMRSSPGSAPTSPSTRSATRPWPTLLSALEHRHRAGVPGRRAAGLARPVRDRVHRARRAVGNGALVHPRPHPGRPRVGPRPRQGHRRRRRHRRRDARRSAPPTQPGAEPATSPPASSSPPARKKASTHPGHRDAHASRARRESRRDGRHRLKSGGLALTRRHRQRHRGRATSR